MGADLFESYVGSIIGTMVIGATFIGVTGFATGNAFGGMNAVLLPLGLACLGIITSIIGTFFVRVKEGGNPQTALNTGEYLAFAIMIVGTYFMVNHFLPDNWTALGESYTCLLYTSDAADEG